jgi:hypothetical protein
LQKTLNYPADFSGGIYNLLNADNESSIIINNGANAVTILGNITLQNKFCVGFVQEGTGDVTISVTGASLKTAIGNKIKGQNDQAFLERKEGTTTFFLLGNTKA